VVLLAGVSWVAWRERGRRPWLLFGWSWYLVTLAPVIGLVQAGAQSIADRYTYVPLLGIFTIVASAGAELTTRRAAWRAPLTAAAVLALVACFIGTVRQIPKWRDGLTLIEHMRAVVGENVIYFREKATALLAEGRPQEEIEEVYRRGHAFAPDYPYFLSELGVSAGRAGRFDEAREKLERVCTLLPDNAEALGTLASLAMIEGQSTEALRLLDRAVALAPRHAQTHRLRAQVLVQQKNFPEARAALEAAVRSDRWDWVARNELGVLLTKSGRYAEAGAHFEHAYWINPRDEGVIRNLNYLRRQ
jgi:Flp pilus assembly protein TadD